VEGRAAPNAAVLWAFSLQMNYPNSLVEMNAGVHPQPEFPLRKKPAPPENPTAACVKLGSITSEEPCMTSGRKDKHSHTATGLTGRHRYSENHTSAFKA